MPRRRGWPAFASGSMFDRSGSDHRVGALCPWPAVNSRDRRTRRVRLMKLTMTSRRSVAIASFAAAVFLAVFGIAGPAQAQQVIVQGNQRVDSETVRSYISGAGAGSLEEARRNLLQTGMFSDVRITRQRLADRRQGEREPADQPCRVRGQPQGRAGDPRARAPDQGARRLLAGGGRCRRAAHPRDLQAHRPRPRERHAAGRRSAERPHRRRVRDQRGRQDRHQGDQLRRKPRLFELAPARSDDLDRVELPQLPQEHGRVRPRPARLRPGADPPLLPQERLRRFPRAGDRRAIRRRPRRLDRHHHGRGGRAIPGRRGQYRFAHRRRRSRDVAPPRPHLGRAGLQRRGGRALAHRRDHRGGPARLCLRPGPPDRHARSGDPHHQHRLCGRGGPARLHRAHQRPRQHPHARLRHPARARCRRGRRLQQGAARSRPSAG